MTGRATGLILLAALALVLTACGGDKAPSKAEFIKQADRSCQDYRERIKPLQTEVRGLSGLPDRQALMKAASIFERVKAEANKLLSKLRDQKRPKGDTMAIDRYVRGAEQQLGDIDGLIAASRQGSTSKFRASLIGLQVRAQMLRSTAQGYGFKVCGSSS